MGSTLATRMQWILANKRRPGGDPWDAKALSIAAGLGNSHVGQIANEKLRSPNLRTLQAIARTAGVSEAWLVSGAGNPDSDDLATAAMPESSVPIHGNVLGWAEVLAEDQREHPDIEPEWWRAGTASAPFLIRGAALPGDAYRLAKIARELSDPLRLANALREAQARVRLLEQQQGAKAKAFDEAVSSRDRSKKQG